MPSLGRLLAAVRQAPLPSGSRAPRFSLTTDDGTWLRIQDYDGETHLVLLFCRSLDADTAAWLQSFSAAAEQLEELQARVLAVHHAPTPQLRAFKEAHGVSLQICYDPLAIESRTWRFASRLLPLGRTGVAIVASDRSVVFHERGAVPLDRVVAELQSLAGGAEAAQAAAPAPTGPPPVQHIGSKRAVELLEGEGGFRLVDVRTGSEFEADHAPMAVHIPVDELPQRYGELGQTERLLFVCQAGGRSAAAAEFLASIGGTDIYNVVGGMSAWSGPRVTGGTAQ